LAFDHVILLFSCAAENLNSNNGNNSTRTHVSQMSSNHFPHVTWDAKGRRDFKAEKQAWLHTQQMFSIEKQNIKCGAPKASNHPSGFFFCFFFLVR
jgi:hypothetical protein